MKNFTALAVALSFGSSFCAFAVSPGRGTSMRSDNNYESINQPLGIWDVAARVDRRNLDVTKDDVKDAKKAAEEAAKAPKKFNKGKKTSRRSKSVVIDRVQTNFAHQMDPGNLPAYYNGIDRSNMKASDKVVYVPANSQIHLSTVRPGDMFKAVIDQEIKASPSVPTPIRAMVTSENLKGAYFVGEATLDRELKRVLLQFGRIRLDSGAAYSVKAAGLSPRGSIGLEGEYHTQAGLFFVGELASATAAGLLDSTINRNQTTFGTYVQEPSLANTAKTGGVTALSKSADRMAEGYRQAPEYTDVTGYQQIQIIIQDDPIELN